MYLPASRNITPGNILKLNLALYGLKQAPRGGMEIWTIFY